MTKITNKLVTATAENNTVRMIAADTTELVNTALKLHDLSPTAAAALGRTLTIAAIMGSMLKNENDTLTIKIKGDGPIGGITAVSDAFSNVRGFVNHPHILLPVRESDGKLDVGGAIGKGFLSVIKDLGMKEPYCSQTELISGEIGVDFTYYFAHSEQTPSAVALGVLAEPDGNIGKAGGYLIQLLPGCEDKTIDYIENTVDALPPVTTLLSWDETPESICELFFGGRNLSILKTSNCSYKCTCSRDRFLAGLISLGKKDLIEIITEGKDVNCHCHFCNKEYSFTVNEIRDNLSEHILFP